MRSERIFATKSRRYFGKISAPSKSPIGISAGTELGVVGVVVAVVTLELRGVSVVLVLRMLLVGGVDSTPFRTGVVTTVCGAAVTALPLGVAGTCPIERFNKLKTCGFKRGSVNCVVRLL